MAETRLRPDEWETSPDSVQLLHSVGEGVFGQVFKAHAWNIRNVAGLTVVAAKQLKGVLLLTSIL